ncbi:MAG: GNAT family N-acetyltransferase [Rhodospirillaceae bacterium]
MRAVIAEAAPADAAEIAALGRVTFAETFTHYTPEDLANFLEAKYQPSLFRACIEDPSEVVFKAVLDGRIVGYAHAGPCVLPHPEVTPTCGELKRLYVKNGYQGSGIGNALLDAALTWLEKPGRTLWIGVFSENFGAQKLYARHGFTKVGDYKFVVGSALDEEFILRRG